MPVEKKQFDKNVDKGFDKKDKKFNFKPRKKKSCQFCAKDAIKVSYKDEKTLRKYISERGKILPRRVTGACSLHQRELVTAINRARHLGILPYVIE